MGEWLSLMEYATRNSVSLSTLRRQIKRGTIQSRLDNGRYLIWDLGTNPQTAPAPTPAHATPPSSDRVVELEVLLKKAREEIVELKTLLAFYEEQSPSSPFSI